MNKKTFLDLLNNVHTRMVSLTKSKGEEYSSSDDQLGNFRRLAEQTGLDMPQIWLVLFTKHLDAIRTWIKDEATGTKRERSEPIEGRIDDAILYLMLLRAIVAERMARGGLDVTNLNSTVVPEVLPVLPPTAKIGDTRLVVDVLYWCSENTLTNPEAREILTKRVNYRHLQHCAHAAYMHGADPKSSACAWIGRMNAHAKEFVEKAEKLGVPFIAIGPIGPEYADERF